MKRFSMILLLAVMLLGLSQTAKAVPASWNLVGGSPAYGTIGLINPGTYMVNGRAIQNGDAIGLFYTHGANTLCAGYLQWNGVDFGIVVWEDDATTSGVKEGYAIGETLVYKMWDNVLNLEVPATVVCDPLFNMCGSTYSSNLMIVLNEVVGSVPLVAPTLTTPANSATGVVTNPSIIWNSVPTATAYDWQVATDNAFVNNFASANGWVSTSAQLNAMNYSTQYFWKVRAKRGAENGPWSAPFSFTTQAAPLLPPVLATPLNNATNVTINPTLTWNVANTATGYVLQVSTDVNFTTFVFNGNNATTSKALTNLAYNTPHYWRVKSLRNAEESSWSTVWSFTTEQMPLVAPVLTAPANLATNVVINPNLTWNAVQTATAYDWQIATDNAFVNIHSSAIDWVSTNAQLSNLAYNTQYFWRARAKRGVEVGPWATAFSFTTQLPPMMPPTLSMPLDDATNVSINPTLSWLPFNTATGYVLQVSTSATFNVLIFDNTVAPTSQALTALNYATEYFWRVKSVRNLEQSAWSAVWSFTTELPPLVAPALVMPLNNASNVALTPTLSWNAAAMVDGYHLQVSTVNTFATTIYDAPVAGLSQALSGLANGTMYFWRVKSIRGANSSAWSSAWSFTTLPAIPPPTQARFISFTNVTTTSINMAWINGAGDGRLVLVTTESFTPTDWTMIINSLNTDPATAYLGVVNGSWANKVTVTAGGKTAHVIGAMVNPGRTLNVTGLTPYTNYCFHVVEYKYSPAIYNPFASVLNPRCKQTLLGVTAPTVASATNVATDMFQPNWTLPANQPVDFFEMELNGTIYDVGAEANTALLNGYYFLFEADANTSYTYKVRTVLNNVRSDWSATNTVVTYPTSTINGPSNVCLGYSSNFILTLPYTAVWNVEGTQDVNITGNTAVIGWTTVGTYDIELDLTDANGNTGTFIYEVTVNDMPVVTCPSSFAVCADANPIDLFSLNGVSPNDDMNGFFVGDGVDMNNVFNPGDFQSLPYVALIGFYYIDPITGCDNICEFEITVNPVPVVTAPNDMAMCIDAQPVQLTGGLPVGGTYSGPGVVNGTFNPATAGAGVHTITYAYANQYTCDGTATFTITVNPLPIVTCPQNMNACTLTPAFALVGATPVGGVYSGVGVLNGMFNPATAGVGVHTITYTYEDMNGCENFCSFTITVEPPPVVTVPNNMMVCVDATPFMLAGATPVGGVYSGVGVIAGEFNPALAGVGTHTITYTYTVGNCSNFGTFTITVNDIPTVTAPNDFTICINANPELLIGGLPVGGTYSGTGVSNNTFDPAVAGAGQHIITYTYADMNGCDNFDTFTITVTPLPTITTQPVDVSAYVADNVQFTVVAANAVSYSWEVSTDAGQTWNLVNGANNATLSLPNVQLVMNGNKYRATIVGCSTIMSNVVSLSVAVPLTPPTVQATALNWLSWSRTQINFNWTNGNGQSRIVVATKDGAWPGGFTPTNDVVYAASPVFGDPSTKHTVGGFDYYVVYNGTGNSLSVTGLSRLTNYTFHVFEYNQQGSQIMYLTSSALGNPATKQTSRKDAEIEEIITDDASFGFSQAYPNPAIDEVSFNVNANVAGDYRIALVNILGETVYSSNLNLGQGSFPVSIKLNDARGSMPAGSYQLVLTSNGKSVVQTVVVVR